MPSQIFAQTSAKWFTYFPDGQILVPLQIPNLAMTFKRNLDIMSKLGIESQNYNAFVFTLDHFRLN